MGEENWEVISRSKVLEHPFLSVTMERVRLPGGEVIGDWPIVAVRDYANAVVLNEAGQVMVLEGYKHGLGRSSWQMVGGYLEDGEDALQAIRRELLEETGYASEQWQALGSFVVDANRRVNVGHFYLARQARQVAAPNHDDLESFEIRWCSVEEATQALLDGRVGIMSSAVNLALALLAIGAAEPGVRETGAGS
jgi:ADP-ribose pyrophosphatase